MTYILSTAAVNSTLVTVSHPCTAGRVTSFLLRGVVLVVLYITGSHLSYTQDRDQSIDTVELSRWHFVERMSTRDYMHNYRSDAAGVLTCALEYHTGDSVVIITRCAYCREHQPTNSDEGTRYWLLGIHNAEKADISYFAQIVKRYEVYSGIILRNCTPEFVTTYASVLHPDLQTIDIEQTPMGRHWDELAASTKLTTIRVKSTDDVPIVKLAALLPNLFEVQIVDARLDLASSKSEFVNTNTIVYVDSQSVEDSDTTGWNNLFQTTGIYIVEDVDKIPENIYTIGVDSLIIKQNETTRLIQSRALRDLKMQCILGRRMITPRGAEGNACFEIMNGGHTTRIAVVSDQEIVINAESQLRAIHSTQTSPIEVR